MKRSLIIVLVFCLLAVIVSAGCTMDADHCACRGLGYQFWESCLCSFDALCDLGTLEEITTYDLATEGKYYSTPKLSFSSNAENGFLTFSMDIYEDFYLSMEIYFVQDGVRLAQYTYSRSCRANTPILIEEEIYLEGYNTHGGEVYFFINSFQASREFIK